MSAGQMEGRAVLDRSKLEAAARVLQAMAHPLRLGIVQALAGGEKTVTALYEELRCSQSTMSQQLRILETQSLVQGRRDGALKYYSLRNRDFLKLFDCMAGHLRQFFKIRPL